MSSKGNKFETATNTLGLRNVSLWEYFDVVPLFLFGVKFQKKKKKIIAIEEITAYVFFYKFYDFRSYIQSIFSVTFCVQCKIVVQFGSFTRGCRFPNTIYWRDCPLSIVYPGSSVRQHFEMSASHFYSGPV